MEKYTEIESMGYLILALENVNKSKKEIMRIVCEVERQMETWVEQVAEEKHNDFFGI